MPQTFDELLTRAACACLDPATPLDVVRLLCDLSMRLWVQEQRIASLRRSNDALNGENDDLLAAVRRVFVTMAN